MKYSLFLTTARGINNLKQAFVVSSPDAEIIIIDKNYNEKTKNELRQLKHDFCKVTYAPPRKEEEKLDEFSYYHYKLDRARGHNTALAYVEAQWVCKFDDSTELCSDFFKLMGEGISLLQKRQGSNKFVIRPVKLEEWNGHKKWEEYPLLKNRSERLFQIGREGIGGYFHTLDQFIFPIESMFLLNGIDERFDIGHGHEDRDMLQRYITLGYPIFLDKMLKTFQIGHRRMIDPIPFTRWLYEITLIEILNGRYRAYNPFDLKELREKMLKEKDKYVIKQKVSEPIATPILVDYAETVGHPIEEQEIRLPLYTSSPAYITGEYPVDKFFSEESLAKNLEKIQALRNKHEGEDLFILGNSPDITKEIVDKLRNKITFAANGFIVAKDAWDYEPTYMVVTNQGTFDNHFRNMKPEFTIDGKSVGGGSVSEVFFKAKKSQFIMSDLVLKPVLLNLPCMRKNERISFLEKHTHIRVLNKKEFEPPYMLDYNIPPSLEDISFDLEKGTYMLGTVITDLMLPLAVWMGFKNIYLKGCSGGAGHFYDVAPRHFWDSERQNKIYTEYYALFKQKLNMFGINIYNLDKSLTESEYIASEGESKKLENITLSQSDPQGVVHAWEGPLFSTRKILGKEPYIIEYRDLAEVL